MPLMTRFMMAAGSCLIILKALADELFILRTIRSKAEKDYIEKFKKWNISAVENQFVTASYATCKYLKEHYEDKKLLVVGTPSF